MSRTLSAVAVAAALLFSQTALAADTRTLCVYDPMGTNGPAYKNAQAMAIESVAKGVAFTLRADVEERTAADDLVAGKCDAILVTGISARGFGLASATVEAIGALPRYDWLKSTLAYLKDPRMAAKMKSGAYENGGIYPAGAVMLYGRDKAWRKSTDLAGKSIAIISADKAAETMARTVGMSTKSATTATFGPMFNSHSVDTIYAPATAYEPLELYRGIGTTGGIINFTLSQLTLQVVLRADRFPAGFGQWAREYAYNYFDKALAVVKQSEAKVAPKLLTIPDADKPGYDTLFQKVRLTLRDGGVYDSTILGLMRRVRCASEAARAECAEAKE